MATTDEIHLHCRKGKTPPSWGPGDTVSYGGRWWTVETMWDDTVDNSGWHYTLVPAPLREEYIQRIPRAEDPGWSEGDAVVAPNGKKMIVSRIRRTQGDVAFLGHPVPPEDPPELIEAFTP